MSEGHAGDVTNPGEWVMRCEAAAGRTYNRAADVAGCYLLAYEPDYAQGRGAAHWTEDVRLARRFRSPEDAWALWRSSPASRPTREDGRPNRPLTAYTVTVLRAAEVIATAHQDG